jgi:hypothetical protein
VRINEKMDRALIILSFDHFVGTGIQPFQYLQAIDDQKGKRREARDSIRPRRRERGTNRPSSHIGLKEIAWKAR